MNGNAFFALFISAFGIGFSSAYVINPRCRTYGKLVQKFRPPSLKLFGLKTNDSFEGKWNPNTHRNRGNLGDQDMSKNFHGRLPPQTHNLADFCFEVGCTVQEYRKITERLKHLKLELSKKMLAIEDELDHLRLGLDLAKNYHKKESNIYPQIPMSLSLPFQSWLSSLIALGIGDGSDWKKRKSSIDSNVAYQSTRNIRSQGNTRNEASIAFLLDQWKQFSDRALAIQNLLTTLKAMEESRPTSFSSSTRGIGIHNAQVIPGKGPSQSGIGNTGPNRREKLTRITTKELACRYRGILEEEGIEISPKVTFNIRKTQKEATVFAYWESLLMSRRQPKPPHLPPTTQEFMNQFNGDHISRTIADSDDDNIDEECIREWFGGTRITTYPIATMTTSNIPRQKFGRTRATTHPFSGIANTTSTRT